MKPIHILLVDDDALFRSALARVLHREADLTICDQAENGQEALTKFQQNRPDLILLDIQMPVMNGIDTVQAIRAIDPHVAILILTTFNETDYITDGLAYGANGYLLKDTSYPKLIQSIRDAMNHEFMLPSAVAAKLSQFVREQRKLENEVTLFPFSMEGFSKREQQILPLFYERLTFEEIADRCDISIRTLRNHLSTIYSKLNVHGKNDAWKAIEQLPRMTPMSVSK